MIGRRIAATLVSEVAMSRGGRAARTAQGGSMWTVALLIGLSCFATLVQAQQGGGAKALTDIAALGQNRGGVVRIVKQGIMTPQSPAQFAPHEITTRRQFAVAVQRLFRLEVAQTGHPSFSDVPATDPDYQSIEAVAPHLQRQAFCPGCAMNTNFRPDAPIGVTLEAVVLTSILVTRSQIELVDPAESPTVVPPTGDLPRLAAPARIFVATAVKTNIVSLDELRIGEIAPSVTRARTAVLLDKVQQVFKIPVVTKP
jgi:hypothetical protein